MDMLPLASPRKSTVVSALIQVIELLMGEDVQRIGTVYLTGAKEVTFGAVTTEHADQKEMMVLSHTITTTTVASLVMVCVDTVEPSKITAGNAAAIG